MTQTLLETISKVPTRQIVQAFLDLHLMRLNLALESLNETQGEILLALALFLQTNRPNLPGYVNKETPCGFPKFTLNNAQSEKLKRWTRAHKNNNYFTSNPKLLGLYLVSNAGSITFSQNAIIEVILLHLPLEIEQYSDLVKKTEILSDFAKKEHLNIKFILSENNPMRHLSLDEFYRKGIWLAGNIPLWWCVHPSFELQYNKYIELLLENRFVDPGSFIDLGCVAEVPPHEYIDENISLLYKAIDDPYKFLLKLIVIEYYISNYPNPCYISSLFKEALYSGQLESIVDGDLFEFKIIDAHLLKQNNLERLTLFRKCFYFKINESFSKFTTRTPLWRKEKIEVLIKLWGWSPLFIAELNERSDWKIEQVLRESYSLSRELSNFYQFTIAFAKKTSITLSDNYAQEMMILGRKIFSIFEKRPGKIEKVNLGISKNLLVNSLVIKSTGTGWEAAQQVSEENTHLDYFKRTSSLLELATWIVRNELYNNKIKLILNSTDQAVNIKKITSLFDVIHNFLTTNTKPLEKKLLQRASQLIRILHIVDPNSEALLDDLRTINVNYEKSDPLSFGKRKKNIISSIDQIIYNSWDEVLIKSFLGINCVVEWIHDFIEQTANPYKEADPDIEFICLDNIYNNTVAARLYKLAISLQKAFKNHPNAKNLRYILPVDTGHLLCQFQNKKFNSVFTHSQSELFLHLSKPQETFSPVIFDNYTESNSILPLLFSAHKPGQLTFFYMPVNDKATIYILDEMGSLFVDYVQFHTDVSLINNYGNFFQKCHLKEAVKESNNITNSGIYFYDFYEIKKIFNEPQMLVEKNDLFNPLLLPPFEIYVTAVKNKKGDLCFSLSCNGVSFSEVDQGKEAYSNAAKFLVNLRPSKEKYSFHIISLDLEVIESEHRKQTIIYLQYKKKIEDLLNASILY